MRGRLGQERAAELARDEPARRPRAGLGLQGHLGPPLRLWRWTSERAERIVAIALGCGRTRWTVAVRGRMRDLGDAVIACLDLHARPIHPAQNGGAALSSFRHEMTASPEPGGPARAWGERGRACEEGGGAVF